MTVEGLGSPGVRGTPAPALDEQVVAALQERLPVVAERTIAALTAEVPEYAGALTGQMGVEVERAVQLALGTFLRLAEARDADPGTPLRPALDAAYTLGRGEARSGRSIDALLAAYRVGARVSWRELSGTVVDSGLTAAALARFAELVFAYIDELSAASAAGHADELATSGRVRQRYLEQLAQALLAQAPADALATAAERADWPPPETLTAVLVPSAQVRGATALLDPRTLDLIVDAGAAGQEVAVLLVPDAHGPRRAVLLRSLHARQAVVGPARPWTQVAASHERAVRAAALVTPGGPAPVDTDEHLAALLLGADPEALADLRARVLAPLAQVRSGSAERLAETLRSWLLHQGRRDDVAADLVVHPQTVRYRMTQLRELYGDRLSDPQTVLELTVALALPAAPAGRPARPPVASAPGAGGPPGPGAAGREERA